MLSARNDLFKSQAMRACVCTLYAHLRAAWHATIDTKPSSASNSMKHQ